MKYLTSKQIVECGKYPFTLGQMRMFLLDRTNNGLEKACKKIGRKVYFREDLFEEWLNKMWKEGK